MNNAHFRNLLIGLSEVSDAALANLVEEWFSSHASTFNLSIIRGHLIIEMLRRLRKQPPVDHIQKELRRIAADNYQGPERRKEPKP